MAMEAADGVATQAPLLEASGLSLAASLFHSLSDPTRLAILRHLSLGEYRVVELTAHLGLAQSTVSRHRACLRDWGRVGSRPAGRASMFSPATRVERPELLGAAVHLLAVLGCGVE